MNARKWLVVAVVAALGVAGAAWVRARQSGDSHSDATERTATLKIGDLVSQITASGRVISNLDVVIKSKASGQVQSLPLNVSDPVHKGDLLVELDPIDEQREVRLQTAKLEAADAQLQQAQQNLTIADTQLAAGRRSAEAELQAAQQRNQETQATLKRVEDLFASHVVNQQELDKARTDAQAAASALEVARAKKDELAVMESSIELRKQDVRLAKAQRESASIALEYAQQKLDETRICSPMDGVVTERMVEIGQIIASGISNIAGGTPIMTVSDLSSLYVIASVDESDIGGVDLGQKAVTTVDAYPGRRFEGKVTRIAAKGVNANNVVTFDVWVQLDKTALSALKPEMTANVEIFAQARRGVVLAPNEAIQYADQGYAIELLKDDGSTERREVQIGASDGVFTELLEGGREGETVVLSSSLRSRWSNAGRGLFAPPPTPADASAPKED